MQREKNPDVNNYPPDSENDNVERPDHENDVPLPPDVQEREPVEDPPYGDESPMGDPSDAPTRIVNERGEEDPRF